MSRHWIRAAALLWLVLALWPSQPTFAQPPTEEPPPPRTLAALEAQLSAIMATHNVPGAAVVLVSRDALLWEGTLGIADVASGRPVTPESYFRIGSISKSFVGLSALQLHEQGRLDLQAPLRQLAPEITFTNRWETTDPVRFVHLLEHTSGFANLRLSHYLRDDPNLTLRAALAETASVRESAWRPGSFALYSNDGPAVAAYVIEKIAGQDYEEYVAQQLFAPLGMSSATFVVTDELRPQVATSYSPDGQSVRPAVNIIARPSGAITLQPRDMAPFMRLFLNEGRMGGRQIVQPDSLRRMAVPTSILAAQHGLEVGYGLNLYATERAGFTFYGHNGGIDGFLSEFGLLPEEGRGFFVNINSSNDLALSEMSALLQGYLTRDLTPPPAPPAVTLSEAELQALAGIYDLTTPSGLPLLKPLERTLLYVPVMLVDGALELTVVGQPPVTLIPLGPRQFRSEEGRGVSLVFSEDPEYGMVLQDGLGLNARRISNAEMARRLGVAVAFTLALLSTLLFALVWSTRWLLRRLHAPHLSVRVLPLLAALCVLGMVTLLIGSQAGGNPLEGLGRPNVFTVGIFLLSLLFPLFSVAGVVQAVRGLRWPIHPGVKLHSLFASLLNLALTVAMAAWGLIGIMLWR